MQTNNYNLEQIKRIETYESLFDHLTNLVNHDTNVIYQASFQQQLKQLLDYYQSNLWLADFTDDHNGLLPNTLKRGILSEDGIYNFITSIDEQVFKQIIKRK